MLFQSVSKMALACFAGFSLVLTCHAQNSDTETFALERFLDSQTVFVVSASAERAGLEGLLDQAALHCPELSAEVKLISRKWQAAAEFLESQKVKRFYLIASLADEYRGSLFCVVPNCQQTEARAMLDWVSYLRAIDNSQTHWGNPNISARNIAGSLVIGTKITLQRLEADSEKPTVDLPNIKQLSADADFSVLARLSTDQQRALIEMVPQLPKWLGSPNTKETLDGIRSVELQVSARPQFSASLVINTSDQATSRQVPVRVAGLAGALAASSAGEPELQNFLSAIVKVPTEITAESCSYKLTIGEALSPYLVKTLAQSFRGTAFDNLKKLMLALHNYESSWKHFPEIKPTGLSPTQLGWRVQILPYLKEAELYNQFHHDEPYDSPHNKQLISKMPAVFRCPLSKFDVTEGLSNFRLPSAAETMWPVDQRVGITDVSDGIASTIAIIEVDDEHAVIWTAPETFAIDLDKPHAGLGGHFADEVFCASLNGAIHSFPRQIDAKLLRGLFTRSSGERVEWPQTSDPSWPKGRPSLSAD